MFGLSLLRMLIHSICIYLFSNHLAQACLFSHWWLSHPALDLCVRKCNGSLILGEKKQVHCDSPWPFYIKLRNTFYTYSAFGGSKPNFHWQICIIIKPVTVRLQTGFLLGLFCFPVKDTVCPLHELRTLLFTRSADNGSLSKCLISIDPSLVLYCISFVLKWYT